MLNVDRIIADNIQSEMEKTGKTQYDLSKGTDISEQRINAIMCGAKSINAIELQKIAEYLEGPVSVLTKFPEVPEDTSLSNLYAGRIKSEEARKGVELADELSDMILFHIRVYKNGQKMEHPWDAE